MPYTIFAVKAEQENASLTKALFQELRQGRARFGWSSEGYDPRDLQDKTERNGWTSLKRDEQDYFAKTSFLLNVRPDDYFVYVNMPSYGRCTVVKIVEREGTRPDDIFQFTPEWGGPPQDDFRSMLPCSFLFEFDRNADVVHPYLSKRLKLMGAHWTIGETAKFEELLRNLHSGASGKSASERLREQVDKQLLTIGNQIYQIHPEKKLEHFVREVMARMPRVKNAVKGPDVNGADLEFKFESGIESLDLGRTEVCAVQVKCYEGVIDDDRAVTDIERALHSDAYTCGLIVTTATSASQRFQSAVGDLRGRLGKPIGLILAKDLAALFLRYGEDPSES